MCGSIFRPRIPSPPPPPTLPPASPPPITDVKQATARPAGYSEASGRNLNVASSYDRKRIGSSRLRIPIVGGI